MGREGVPERAPWLASLDPFAWTDKNGVYQALNVLIEVGSSRDGVLRLTVRLFSGQPACCLLFS